MDASNINQLAGVGFCVSHDEAPLEELASSLGEPIRVFASDPIPERLLVPNPHSVRGWLSYGQLLGFLPFHTDCPHFELPPRYLLLRLVCSGSVSCETVLADPLSRLPERTLLTESPWLRSSPSGRQKSCRILERTPHGPILRFDDVSMRPAFGRHEVCRSLLLQACTSSIIFQRELKKGETLVVDNWRLMHARRLIGVSEGPILVPRVVERVLVKSCAVSMI